MGRRDATEKVAAKVLAVLRAQRLKLVTAESCTGGLIAAALTDIPGSSDVFERGFVTYSNEAKHDLLGVPQATLDQHGAVSEQTAQAMAHGARARSRADISIAVTGIAGPDGGTPAKPVGLVYIASAGQCVEVRVKEHRFGDIGRAAIREKTVIAAFNLIVRVAQALPEGH